MDFAAVSSSRACEVTGGQKEECAEQGSSAPPPRDVFSTLYSTPPACSGRTSCEGSVRDPEAHQSVPHQADGHSRPKGRTAAGEFLPRKTRSPLRLMCLGFAVWRTCSCSSGGEYEEFSSRKTQRRRQTSGHTAHVASCRGFNPTLLQMLLPAAASLKLMSKSSERKPTADDAHANRSDEICMLLGPVPTY